MKITDACIFPYPDGDSTVSRMAIEAGELGFDSLVAIGDAGHRFSCAVEILQGAIITARSVKEVLRDPAVRRADLVCVDAGDLSFNRALASTKDVNVISKIHATRQNAFDHVAARTAAERGVAVEISIAPLIHLRGMKRQQALNRYADILALHRRYGFMLTLSSAASSILDQRSVREIRGLCGLFGMTGAEVNEALSSVGRMIEHSSPPGGAVR
jgi:ribonuclease P/MRP protein subunit RPP1